jgi:glycosyltransferase involved in cell wall biosynthesis
LSTDYALTLCVPTLDRPEFLAKCLTSLMKQSIPSKIVIGDQGETKATRKVVRKFEKKLDIEHRLTGATSLWDNWKKTIAGCETRYAAWVQDDDELSPYYAARIVTGLDNHRGSAVWIARLSMSYNTTGYSCWWEGNGPPLPLDTLNMGVAEVNGDMLMALAPFISPALSPAIAFRIRPGFDDMLATIPNDCDLFHERMHVAEWCKGDKGDRRVLCDPWLVGVWYMHEGNISKVYNRDKAMRRRQRKVFFEWLAPRFQEFDWKDMLQSWSVLVSPNTIRAILGTLREFKAYQLARDVADALREVYPGIKGRSPRVVM